MKAMLALLDIAEAPSIRILALRSTEGGMEVMLGDAELTSWKPGLLRGGSPLWLVGWTLVGTASSTLRGVNTLLPRGVAMLQSADSTSVRVCASEVEGVDDTAVEG